MTRSKPPFFKWWVGGKLNACVNCVDRHLEERGDQNALIWVAEPEDVEPVEITYRELHRRVNEFAALAEGPRRAEPATGSPSTCRWFPICRSRCSRARGSA